jgi:hypothetical protein
MSTSKLSDPRYIGPGSWFVIHTTARYADTIQKKRDFSGFMKRFCEEFRCKECSGHCQKYIKDHPIEPYFNLRSPHGEEIGCFKWTWKFHNAVNNRLGKPIVDFQTAYDMYFEWKGSNNVCSSNCAREEEVVPSRREPKSKTPVVYLVKGGFTGR